jgi:autotransporter-associated beta strand protein
VATAQNLPVTFTVVASGHQPISYQWLKNGLPIAGATNSSYTYSPTFADNNASFQLLATNTVGGSIYSAASGTASLSVSVPATLTWYNNSQDGAWNLTSGNWNAGGVDYAQFDGVVFNDSDANNSTPGATIDLQFAASPLGVTVSNTVDSYEITSYSADGALTVLGTLVKEGPGSLTLDVTNNSTGPVEVLGGTLQIGNGDTYGSLGSGPVTNNGALVFDRSDSIGVANDLHGTGSVVLNSGMITPTSTNNDYAGGTTINAGVIYAGNSESLGAANGGVVVNSGGQLYITGNVNFGVKPISLNGTGDGNGALRKGGAGATAYAGPVTLADDTTIGVDSGATLTLSNTISGNAALTAVGTGTMALDTTNSFSGGFTLNGPVIDLNANQALGPGLVTVSGTGRLVLASGLTFTNEVIASTVSPGVATGLLMVNDNTNGIVTTVSGPLEFDATPANGSDFYGPTSSGYLNITGSITNLSSGVVGARNGFVRFSGGGNYATFNLNQGTTSLGANNGLSTNATLSIGASGAATLDLNGFNQALTGLANGAANAELITNSGASQSTLTLDLSSSSSFMGTIAGNIALVETGSGSLDLTGTNSYTGDTTVSGGTLEIGQPTFAARSTVTVASGATLQMDFTTTNTVAALVLNGVSQPLGLYNASSSPSYLNGSGSLLVAVTVATYPTNLIAKVSNGSLTLSWPADHTGWRLLTQTNSLATGLVTSTNNWSTVANSANTNVVNVTIDPTQPAVFYRMVYP